MVDIVSKKKDIYIYSAYVIRKSEVDNVNKKISIEK